MFTPFAFIQPITTAAPIVPALQYLLIGGQFTSWNTPRTPRFAKIDENGDLNSTFNAGAAFSSGVVYDIQQQPDGKYVMVGSFTQYSGSSVPSAANKILRINQDGTQDVTFRLGTGFNPTINVRSISPQSDNSNIVVGEFLNYSGSAVSQSIVKITPSGSIDGSFNVGLGFNSTAVYKVITQADGKSVVIGTFTQYSSSNNYTTRTDLLGSTNGGPTTDFNFGKGFDNSVNSFVTQSDGKIIAGGFFTQYSGSSVNRIIRINPDGTLDTSFNIGTGCDNTVTDIGVQSDGKIIAIGTFATYSGSTSNRIVRINTDGTRDTSFNVGTGFNGQNNRIRIQSDGKILVGGGSTTYSGSTQNYITRINTDGTRDTSFNIGTGFNALVNGLAIQPNGNIVVAGNFTTYSGSSTNTTRIIRLNDSGSQDTSFVTGTGFNLIVYNLALEPTTNKIVVVGSFTAYSGSAINRIVRINTDGTRDTSFNVGTGFTNSDSIRNHLSIQSDNKIYVGVPSLSYSGSSIGEFARINPSGTLDTTFIGYPGTSPAYYTGFQSYVSTVFISGSSIYFGGNFASYFGTYGLIRINPDGTQDTTFQMGRAISNIPFTVVTQSDGKFLIGGQSINTYSGSSVSNFFRVNTDGTLDTTFQPGTINGIVTGITVQPDEKIVAIGSFTSVSGSTYNRIVRVNPNGTLDPTFNVGTGLDVMSAVVGQSAIQSLPDNRIYVTTPSLTTYSGSYTGNFLRINPSGALDPTFPTTSGYFNIPVGGFITNGAGGYSILLSGSSVFIGGGGFDLYKQVFVNRGIMIDSTGAISSSFNIGVNTSTGLGFNTTIRTWATQSDGKILAGGDFVQYSGSSTNTVRIIRLNRNGTQDTSFVTGVGFNSTVYDLRVQPDDKIIAVGAFTSYSGSATSGIVRINTNGTRDATFNVGTGLTGGVDGRHCKIQPDGKIVVVGAFTAYSGSAINRIVRINTDGTRDTSFNVGVGFPGAAESVILQPDGKILVAGQFISYSGSTQNRITRINTDGTRDTTFNIGTGFGGAVYALALQSDEKIIVTHQNLSYSGSTTRYITRINPSGTFDPTFNANINPIGFSATSNTQNSLAIDASGSIYWGNAFTTFSGSFIPNRIVRLNTNGSVDETFNQAFPNYGNDTGKGANGTINAVLLL